MSALVPYQKPRRPFPFRKHILTVLPLLLIVMLLFAFRTSAEDAGPIVADRVLGKPDAPVTIYDYSSLTCPHCAKFHATVLPALKKQFIDTGKVKLIYRDYPLDKIALQASILARCVDEKQFYPLLDALFQNQSKWALAKDPTESLGAYGILAGLPRDKFNACLKDKKLEKAILATQLQAQQKYKINSTPTFVLNDGAKILTGEASVKDFAKAINSLK